MKIETPGFADLVTWVVHRATEACVLLAKMDGDQNQTFALLYDLSSVASVRIFFFLILLTLRKNSQPS